MSGQSIFRESVHRREKEMANIKAVNITVVG